MLVTSTSVSPAHSVIISQTKSILGFGTAVKSILCNTISSRDDAKSINDNGFLSDLANGLNFFFGLTIPRCAKSSLSKFKSLIFFSSYLFCMVAIHLQNWCMMGLLNQCELLLPLKTLQQQHDFHVYITCRSSALLFVVCFKREMSKSRNRRELDTNDG